jgi:hypothetical protein
VSHGGHWAADVIQLPGAGETSRRGSIVTIAPKQSKGYALHLEFCTFRSQPPYGEPVLAEDQVLAWLTAHGATVQTGPLSHVTAVQGMRVVP